MKNYFAKIIKKSEIYKKNIHNIVWLFSDKLLKYTLGIVLISWTARYLGPEQYGVLSYAIAFSSLFSILASLGLNKIVVRELVKNSDKKNEILGSALLMMTITGGITWILASFFISLMRPSDEQTFWLVVIISASFIFNSFRSISCYFDAKIESKFIVIATTISFALSSIFKIILIITKQSLLLFAIASLLEAIFLAISLVLIYSWKKLRIFDLRWDSTIAKKMLTDSFPLILSGLMIAIFMRIDQIMLREMVSNKEAGLYSVVVQITEIWFFVPVIIRTSVFPNIINSKNDEILYKKIEYLFQLMVFFSLFIAIPISIFSNQIIELLFGEDYLASSTMLSISIWSLLFTSLGIAKGAFIITKNYVRESFYFTSLGAISNIFLNYLLLPIYGGEGAALSTVISVCISAYLSNFLFSPLFKIGKLMTRSIFFLNLIKR